MADYAKEMKALEGMITQEEANEMSQRDRYNDGAQIANMMTPISKPSQGSAEILLKSQPMDRSAEMEMAWTGGSKSRVDSSLNKQKNLLEQYKRLQDAKLSGDKLALQSAELKQKQTNFDRMLELKKQMHRDSLINKAKKPQGSIGQSAVDREFAKEYVDYIAKGGYTDTQKQLSQLQESLNTLKSGANVSGLAAGLTPDWLQSVTNPKALETKERIEEVVQRNLRAVLGAQFTEKEGERLIKRAFNPYLSEEENTMRLEKLMRQIADAAEKKKQATEYFEQNGTLTGFTGNLPTMNDFNIEDKEQESEYDSLGDDELDQMLGL